MTPKCLYLGQKKYQNRWVNEDIFMNRNDAREWKRRETEKGHQVKVIEYKSNANLEQQAKVFNEWVKQQKKR